MPHLVLHLPRELYWCGSVHARWMYSVERYIGHIKTLVQNKARPEGSIAMRYLNEEALGFVTQHFCMYLVAARLLWDIDEDDRDSSEVLEGTPIERRWSEKDLLDIHNHIISNSLITEQLHRFRSLSNLHLM